MNPQKENSRADNDMGWKQILQAHLKEFMEFFWYEAYQDIDWSRPYEFLEQELMAIAVKEEIGKRYIDKLFKVYLKNGKEQWLLLHIEIQHTKKKTFPEVMFTYFYRIYDRYHQDVASLAILADKNPNWRPNQYCRRVWKSEIIRTYEVVKLIDFKPRIAELRQHPNPFAMVVLIHLAALETKANNQNRLLTKLEFFRNLHLQGWSFEKSMNMYRFLDAILSLNPKFEVEYIEKAKEIDQEFHMQLTLTAERYGFRQGEQQGEQRGFQHGEAHILTSILRAKFKELPESYVQKINNSEPDILNQWAINSVAAQTLEQVFK